MLFELLHHGVVVPEPPKALGLEVTIRGRRQTLDPRQEEMAMAWARKKDTPYVQDAVFAANFLRDFSAALGLKESLTLGEVDFGACYAQVERERAERASLTPDERKALARERAQQREALRARYGYAIVNAQRVELGTYLVEPSSIFMGRGQHPLRGRWKEGAARSDITLNLGPNQSGLEGEWGGVVWEPQSMWVARWKDRLTGKLKYIWLSDTAPVKQAREAGKFDKATELASRLDEVRARIDEALRERNGRRRMVATVCYLIDRLCLRVGDEKDADEADTVGATTLRPEHLVLHEGGTAEFSFLGKDSVPWHKRIVLPPDVLESLRGLWEQSRALAEASAPAQRSARELPQIFPDVNSSSVNGFLSRIMPGLSAKVFRTHHATQEVEKSLVYAGVAPSAPEIVKWRVATDANLAAAILCNHTKQEREITAEARERAGQRLVSARARLAAVEREYVAEAGALRSLEEQGSSAADAVSPVAQARADALNARRLESARKRLQALAARLARARSALQVVETQQDVSARKRGWNLGTSLKSYIDPRVYYRWGQAIGYDVLDRYYPTTLRRKYAWVREDETGQSAGDVSIRTCVASDLPEVAELLDRVADAYPDILRASSREGLAEAFLPGLEREWRESFIARDEDDALIAVVVLGPPRNVGEATHLDLFAAIDPASAAPGLGRRLADEARRRARTWILAQKAGAELRPSGTDWCVAAADLAAALGLSPDDTAQRPGRANA